MSEAESGQGDPAGAPEPPEDEEAGPDTSEDDEEAQETADAPTGGESLDAQKQHQDEAYSAIATKANNYAKAAAVLVQEGNLTLSVCELCNDAYPGFRWDDPQDDAHRAVLEAFYGSQDLESLKAVEWAIRCRGCDGRGFVKTGSLIAGNEAIRCRKCNGAGYEVLDQDTGVVVPPRSDNGETEPAQLEGVNPADPRVRELAEMGYTIIPPMKAVAPPGVT
jgi:hypothetical protein